MDPGQDGDAELDETGYWNVSLCTGVGGGVGSSVDIDDTDGVGITSVSVGNRSKNSWKYHTRQKIIHNSVKTYDILIK